MLTNPIECITPIFQIIKLEAGSKIKSLSRKEPIHFYLSFEAKNLFFKPDTSHINPPLTGLCRTDLKTIIQKSPVTELWYSAMIDKSFTEIYYKILYKTCLKQISKNNQQNNMKPNEETENLAINEIPDSPLFTAEINDPKFNLQGWIVIHSIGSRGSCGGVRLYPVVTKKEVQLLAKAMTYKYCFYEMQLGGAKAALTLPFDADPPDRTALLIKFGEHLAPLIKARIYWPWIL